jgi:uncharacterized ubiquitin-like protein YukD
MPLPLNTEDEPGEDERAAVQTLRARFPHMEPGASVMFVKNMTGNHMTSIVTLLKLEDTVWAAKERIAKDLKQPARKQILMYKDLVLRNDQPLGSYHITEGAMLKVKVE